MSPLLGMPWKLEHNLGPNMTPIWDPELGPRFGDPNLGPRFGTLI
jgi:hypothetical protein